MTDHPARGRFNAWLLDALDRYMHRNYVDIKSALLRRAPSVVVELGPGTGANLRYLTPGTRLIAIEPNRHMHPLLRRRAKQFGIDLDLRGLAAEQLDLPSASVDFVFGSLVLCTVGDPERVISEVRRVLKPGGQFACVEHVEAPAGSGVHRIQRAIRRPWRWVFEGCDLCRDTGATLQSSGFSTVAVTPLVLPRMFLPIRHQIAVVCVR
jgi:ubiquinone/menaquinone biosynthesis C-methylase UbiE